MRRLDETPIDPEIVAALDAIDATLGGEAVDPRHAELAELALLLRDERPRTDPAFATALDERVDLRFIRARRARPRRRWLWAPAAGLAAAVVVAVVIVIGAGGGHTRFAPAIAKAPAPSAGRAAAPLSVPATSPAHGATLDALQPPPNGRKILQGAQLALSAAPDRVDAVAQEVFDVVGQRRGVVNSSSVTAGGSGGYAQFQLSIPSGSLSETMAALSTLRYSHVASRTDTSQDVNDQYQADVRRLADARALRTSLLRQLASATTQAQIDSLTARIHDAEASISSDQAALRALDRQIGMSQVTVTITAGSALIPVGRGGGGFTLGKAAHDAGRVLTVAAGVVLIAAAAVLPLALIGALGWWIAGVARRRRREQALDAL